MDGPRFGESAGLSKGLVRGVPYPAAFDEVSMKFAALGSAAGSFKPPTAPARALLGISVGARPRTKKKKTHTMARVDAYN